MIRMTRILLNQASIMGTNICQLISVFRVISLINCRKIASNKAEEQKRSVRHYTPHPFYTVCVCYGETEIHD